MLLNVRRKLDKVNLVWKFEKFDYLRFLGPVSCAKILWNNLPIQKNKKVHLILFTLIPFFDLT